MQTEKGATFSDKLQLVSTRLKASVMVTIIALLGLAYEGGTGMQHSSDAIEDLYSQGMQHAIRAGDVLALLGQARSSLLLSLQHDPESMYAHLHNHDLSLHVDDIKESITALHKIVDDEISTSALNDQERQQVNKLITNLDKITDEGFTPALKWLDEGDYSGANLTLLKVINPAFELVKEDAQDFLDLQVAEGKSSFEQSQKNTQQFFITVALSVAISVLIISWLSYLIIKRTQLATNELKETANKIAHGDLTQRVNVNGRDEFSHISQYVNDIVTSFQSLVKSTSSSTSQLACSAEENATVSEETKHHVLDQQQQTQMIATAIHEFTATVHEVAESASSASQASEEADVAAIEGKKIVGESIDMIEDLSTEMQEIVSAMQSLAQHAEDISSVVDVIQSISEQTNLLALNAAIEAARAGEQGRGFAVVADEVRTLASRTQKSTQEILQTIQNLQQGSRESTHRLEKGAENAKHTAQEAQKAGHALTRISESVVRINDMNAQIATAAEEQSAVTEEINRNITTISDISLQTATGAEQSSCASAELARLAETMQGKISAFKV